MVWLGIVPLFGLLAPFYLLLWNWRQVLLHFSFGLILSLILVDVLLFRFQKIPFTCAYLPGKANLKLLWPAYMLAFTTYAYTLTTLESWMLREPVRFAVFFAIILFSWPALSSAGHGGLTGTAPRCSPVSCFRGLWRMLGLERSKFVLDTRSALEFLELLLKIIPARLQQFAGGFCLSFHVLNLGFHGAWPGSSGGS